MAKEGGLGVTVEFIVVYRRVIVDDSLSKHVARARQVVHNSTAAADAVRSRSRPPIVMCRRCLRKRTARRHHGTVGQSERVSVCYPSRSGAAEPGRDFDRPISEAPHAAGEVSPMPIDDAMVHVPFPYQFPLLIPPVASQTFCAVGETRAPISGENKARDFAR